MELLLVIAFVLVIAYFFEWLLRQLKIGNYESRYVLITGCDSGFGHELAKKLDKLGFNVFACCLTKTAVEKFSAMSSSKLKALELDVTKDASIEKAMEIVKRALPQGKVFSSGASYMKMHYVQDLSVSPFLEKFLKNDPGIEINVIQKDQCDTEGLWAVVNNAGVTAGMGSIKLHTRQEYENTLAVNLYGVIMVTKACMSLVLMEKGRFVNTSSVLGRIACLFSSYCISKYGVEAFSDVLRRELYRTGAKVQIIEPGGFKTQIWGHIMRLAENKVASLPAEVKSQLPDDATEQLTGAMARIVETTSTDIHLVVDAYCHAITAKFPKKRYMVGHDAKYYWLLSVLPECMSDFYAEWQGFNLI